MRSVHMLLFHSLLCHCQGAAVLDGMACGQDWCPPVLCIFCFIFPPPGGGGGQNGGGQFMINKPGTSCLRVPLVLSLLSKPVVILSWGQILYSYPAGKTVTPDVASFCFPHGVQPVLLERTPSMSALNEVIYSQQYRSSDGQSFIFLMKVCLQPGF